MLRIVTDGAGDILPAWKAGVYRLAQTLLAWDDPTSQLERHNLRRDIAIEMAEGAQDSPDERVMNIVEKVGAFKMGAAALIQRVKACELILVAPSLFI